jgi:hypothetical protein
MYYLLQVLIKPFFESFDKSAIENVLTQLERIKATKETQEVVTTASYSIIN